MWKVSADKGDFVFLRVISYLQTANWDWSQLFKQKQQPGFWLASLAEGKCVSCSVTPVAVLIL